MDDIYPIRNYILYLKEHCGLSVTLHPLMKESVILPSELSTFNIHDNSYCVYIKTHPDAHRHCVERQGKILERCRSGPFCGKCFAGVAEYVYPVLRDGAPIGFICVSGYRCDDGESHLHTVSTRYGIPKRKLRELYATLKAPLPERDYVDTLLLPLCRMLELAYLKAGDEGTGDEESLVDRAIRYCKRYHTSRLTLDTLCKSLSCSRSHISHQLKAATGKTFTEHLTALRLEDARSLLTYSHLSVTEIAYSVGFEDSNYFSCVFKRHMGLSPLSYRRKHQKAK